MRLRFSKYEETPAKARNASTATSDAADPELMSQYGEAFRVGIPLSSAWGHHYLALTQNDVSAQACVKSALL